MRIDINGIYIALSFALDEVEAELIDIEKGHGKRVALYAVVLGKAMGLSDDALSDLIGLSILHDNALTEYIYEERLNRSNNIGNHCTIGEENIKDFPFKTSCNEAILYHHENYDGTGIFHKRYDEISLYAQLIHFGDSIDVYTTMNKEITYDELIKYLKSQENKMYSSKLVNTFIENIDSKYYYQIYHDDTYNLLNTVLPLKEEEYSFKEIKSIVDIFAKIVDYKSEFTKNHSLGVAQKAYEMGHFYQYDESICERLYIAGAFHDIGKMVINNSILEKNTFLTDIEFEKIKSHAYMTNAILKNIKGFEDICKWASNHHEKLNGKGYPLGKQANELDHEDRLLGVLDIFQALREDRPYKKGMEDGQVVSIMSSMIDKNEIDRGITYDVLGFYLKKEII